MSKVKFELTEEMEKALSQLGQEVDKDHICDRCLSRMDLQVGFIASLRIILYSCKACGHEDIREAIGG